MGDPLPSSIKSQIRSVFDTNHLLLNNSINELV